MTLRFRIPVLFAALLLACQPAFADDSNAQSKSPSAQSSSATAQLPLDEIRAFTEVFGKIKSDYVEPVKDKTLLEDAIQGMLEGLDPHSAYLDKKAYAQLQEGTTGEFGGIGIEVGVEDGFVKVISPIDDTPAARAGIKPGDLIIRLNGTPLKGLPLNNAVNMMRGKPGTSLTLTIVRQGVEKPLKVKLKRAIITIKSVRARTLDPGYGYLRISQFQTHTANELQNAVARLKKDNGGKLKGVVLDLRNNPGGVLSAAVAVSDMFLSKGLIVYTKGRVKDSAMRFTAKPNDVLHKAPIVVLVNGGTASASEIVAGALQDNKRALIMGQQTFGKGSVQTILPMPDDTALKLTTARYYTPSGRSIQASGITPDIVIPEVKVEKVSPEIATVKEVNLSGHLANPNAPAPAKKENTSIAEPSPTKDYALSQALNVLKALAIFRNGAG